MYKFTAPTAAHHLISVDIRMRSHLLIAITLVHKFGLSPHLYADDTQIYGACSPVNVDAFIKSNQILLKAEGQDGH